jgi:hypothetical protein
MPLSMRAGNARQSFGRSSTAGGSAPSGDVLHEFTLTNTSGSTSGVMARLGLAFQAGDVPSGSVVKVRAQGGADVAFAALVSPNTWADGSIRSTADGGLVMIDTNTIAGSGSRTYEVYAASGTQATSGLSKANVASKITGLPSDPSVAITSHTGSSNNTNVGNLTFSSQTAVATTTRHEIIGDTARFVRSKVWQQVGSDVHLICEHHLDLWLDGSGNVLAVEWAPVLTQHWFVANPFGVSMTKQARSYTATVNYGSAVDTRTISGHAYYCRWASLRSADDPQHARKHWLNISSTPMPTLRVVYSDASLKKMMKSGYIPPLRLGVNYTSDQITLPTTYTPLGLNGHRAAISGTGAYVARGMWGDVDAKLVCRHASATGATAIAAWRAARVMAQAGLAGYFHTRDHRSVSGVNGGTDTTNRIIPLPFRRITESYTGLASPAIAVRDLSLSEGLTGYTVLTEDDEVGGTGSFSNFDTSHVYNSAAPMAFLEGEMYLGEAALSSLYMSCNYLYWNRFLCDPWLLYGESTPRATAQSIPTGAASDTYNYGAVPDMVARSEPWAGASIYSMLIGW